MKLTHMILAAAVATTVFSLPATPLARAAEPEIHGQVPTNPPVAPTPPAVPTTDPAAQPIAQAADPSAAVAAYAAVVARVGPNNLAAEDAYVRRMIDFNLPDLAGDQAQDVVRQDPNNVTARAVVAYVQGRRGQAVDALASIVKATTPTGAPDEKPVTDPFVLRTAGQLVAWFDTRADKAQVPEQLKQDIESMRKRLSAQDAYGEAYGSARDLYQGKQQQQPSASVVPQPQQPAAPQQPSPTVVQPYIPAPVYDDSSLYYPTYSTYYPGGYYYQPTYYWSRDYRRPGRYYLNDPAYCPPVIIPDRHQSDWERNRNWHGNDNDHHDHHDNGGYAIPTPPIDTPTRPRHVDGMRVSPNRDDAVSVVREQSPGAGINIPQSHARFSQEVDAPSRTAPVVPERHIDVPSRAEAAHPAPTPAPRSSSSNDGNSSSSHQERGYAGPRH